MLDRTDTTSAPEIQQIIPCRLQERHISTEPFC